MASYVHVRKFVLECLIFYLSCIVCFAKAECTFDMINSETESNLPVPFFNHTYEYELVIPKQGSIRLENGENLTLLCCGNRNYVKQTNANVTTVMCIEHDQVQLFGKIQKFQDIQCKLIVKGDVRPTNNNCGNNRGRFFEIGYPVTRTDWVTLITVCHVPENGNTLYTRHIIHGEQIKHASKSKTRMGWSNTGQNTDIPSSIAYRKDYQKPRFSKIFGSSKFASNYINSKQFLARGHLSPRADFLLATTQFTTYYYMNAAPQWQSINAASWMSIEYTVRDLAMNYGDLEIITGTYDVLNLNDEKNNLRDIYLGSNQILPVPKYFWKIVFEPLLNRAIVFVTLNNPFIDSENGIAFCIDICSDVGFTKKSWKVLSSGYVFCCEYDEFRRVVDTAPDLDVSEVLKEPNFDLRRPLKRVRIGN